MLVFNGKNIQVSHSLLADWKPTIHEKLSEVENLLGRSFVMGLRCLFVRIADDVRSEISCTDSTCEDIFQKDNYISKIICEEFTITRVDIFGRLAGLLETFHLQNIIRDIDLKFGSSRSTNIDDSPETFTSREKLSKPSIGRVSGLERSLAEDEEGDASTEAGRELKREVEVEVGASSNYERLGRMLTARSGPLGVPRSLGPLEGSDHLFLLPERALIMDSSRLRQDLAGLDFNLRFNILQTAPRGNVWLCEYTQIKAVTKFKNVEMDFSLTISVSRVF
ncbi:hypothetical protein HZH68_003230 [Vespula germanica]|uniref:Uncharacterized protein n=1 Tax=Vespula germanica TaxID=30212 RepID=A0A834NNP1_VESGE|nr:hypothetical protein HZH68_003230 [Vespula germanica]